MPRKTRTEDAVEQVETTSTEEQAVPEQETGIKELVAGSREADWQRIAEELAKPFPPGHIRVKPGKVSSNGSALALWYIDARAVMDRLDRVVGPENWEFSWQPIISEGRVVVQGIMTVCGVTKSDVGEAKGEDEPWKSGVSDAFKRTAVQFGIGRFLYRLPQVWWPYDEQSRRFAQQDELEEFVQRVMRDLEQVDGDTTQINMKDYSDLLSRDRSGSRGGYRSESRAKETSGDSGFDEGDQRSTDRAGITPAQENYIRRLYTQKFGRFSNGNVLFANFLKQNIGRVCPIEKFTRSEADTVIKNLQEMASAA